ncbi:Dolichyldiphosphatase 1 [Balamuthia mandrillaris]
MSAPDLLICLPDLSLLSLLMGLYSFVPHALFILHCALILVFRKMPRLFLPLLLALLLSEGLLKNSFRQPRPHDSCANSYGMPSSHSLLAATSFTYYLSVLLAKSTAAVQGLTHWGRYGWCVAHLFLWAPVPLSRVYLRYHTVSQVICGSMVGVGWGLFLFYLFQVEGVGRSWNLRFRDRHHHRSPYVWRWRKHKEERDETVEQNEEEERENSANMFVPGISSSLEMGQRYLVP